MLNLWNGSNTMRKKVLIILLVLSLLLSFTGYYIYTGIQNRNKCEAKYIKDADGEIIGISYNEKNYYEWDYMIDNSFFEYDDSTIYDGYPYNLVVDEEESYTEYIYIEQDEFSDYTLHFDNYFFYFSETYDKNRDFIVENRSNYSRNEKYVDENFVFPTIESNKVNEVWMSLFSEDKGNIKNKEIVDKIVECAKSDGKIELDKDIYDYIKKYSTDHHCLWLKYEGYPIVEEFHIEETEDGRYIVSQYDIEDYYRLSQEDEAHQ